MKADAYFYYDLISPFSYFFLKSRKVFEKKLEIIPIPIFVAGMFKIQNNRGPAEVPEKRVYTYQFCVWKAQKLIVPFKFPPRHPFSSVSAQRLLLQNQANLSMLDKAFDFVWALGRDPEIEWEAFCLAIGLPGNTPKPLDDDVKQALIQSTEIAAQNGVFGVPSLRINNQVFWGHDSIEWILDFLENPSMFSEVPYQDALLIKNPLMER